MKLRGGAENLSMFLDGQGGRVNLPFTNADRCSFISFGLSRTMEFFQVEKSNYSLTEFANLAFDMALVFRSTSNLIRRLYQLNSLIS